MPRRPPSEKPHPGVARTEQRLSIFIQFKLPLPLFAWLLTALIIAPYPLSAAEKEVFILIPKGCSHSEISGIRNTAEGTVKAQGVQICRA